MALPPPALALVAATAVAVLAGCGGEEEETPPARTDKAPAVRTDRNGPRLERARGEARVETVATGLEAPWEIAFLPDGRALVTERAGRVRLLTKRLRLRPRPAAEIEVAQIGEGGLLGLAVDPEFDRNRFVYLYRTTDEGNEVVRYRLQGERLRDEKVIADSIEAGAIHDGGRIRFGPDGRLYFATGDAGQDGLAQDPRSLNGKFLRMEPEDFRGGGGRPEVVSIGHRNPQGFDWQPRTERLVASEHGPDGDDEVNAIREGANYGWPQARGEEHGRFAAPLQVYPQSLAPSGATFVELPGSAWTGDYLIAFLVGEQVRRLRFEGGRVVGDEPLFEGAFGRVRTLVEGPDGALYALTSNRDGRGAPRDGDDRVIRIVPPAG
jgi:glucose/arabinose dehydrogenase